MNTDTQTPKRKAPAPKKTATVKTAKAGTGKGKATGQTQTGASLGQQGEGTSGKAPAAVVAAVAAKVAPKKPAPSKPVKIGGTEKVAIEVVAVPKKPYSTRAVRPEAYPFGTIAPAVKLPDGTIEGESFFIPDANDADQKIQTARKRHKSITFWARSRMEKIGGKGPLVPGKRVWRGSPDMEPPK